MHDLRKHPDSDMVPGVRVTNPRGQVLQLADPGSLY